MLHPIGLHDHEKDGKFLSPLLDSKNVKRQAAVMGISLTSTFLINLLTRMNHCKFPPLFLMAAGRTIFYVALFFSASALSPPK
jgi:hypothetical protein